MGFPIVSCETLKKSIGPLRFLLKVKGGPMKTLSFGSNRYASDVWYATMWLALGSMKGFFTYNIGSKECSEGI